jgi:hypothetical protein
MMGNRGSWPLGMGSAISDYLAAPKKGQCVTVGRILFQGVSHLRNVLLCWSSFVVVAAMSPRLDAAFIGPYEFAKFSLSNSNADGFAVLTGDGSVGLTGGNDGSAIPGITDLWLVAPASGTVSFSYSYSSLDFPGFDSAGFILNGFVQLADSDGEFGGAVFSVLAGDVFGFRVATADNTGEPGVFTVSNFIGPDAGDDPGVPETSTFLAVAIGLSAITGWKKVSEFAKKSNGGGRIQ